MEARRFVNIEIKNIELFYYEYYYLTPSLSTKVLDPFDTNKVIYFILLFLLWVRLENVYSIPKNLYYF